MKRILIVFIFLLRSIHFSTSISCDVTPKNKEAELKQKLFCTYDKEQRPTSNPKNATIVKLLMFVQSFEFYDHQGSLDVSSWMGMKWKDDHLKWNKNDYDGIDSITVHSDDIWMPDLSSYHHESTQYSETCSPSHCLLSNDGSVSCIPPCSHTGNCDTDFSNWPFDVQKCRLHFGSWMHKGSEVKFKAERVSVKEKARHHNEWKIASIKSETLRGNYSCCPNETYPSVKYTFIIERHSTSEKTFIVSPAIILSSLNLISLWLFPNCSERLLVNIVSMFSHFMFMQQLSWLVPKNGEIAPNALLYFRDSMVIACVLLLDTIIKRGLLLCKSNTPTWLQSTTSTLRGNRIGQLMFTNPYLINNVPLDNETTAEDAAHLVEEQCDKAKETSTENPTERNIWYITVRSLDTAMFFALFIAYFVLFFGWIPMSYTEKQQGIDIEIVPENAPNS